MLIQDLLPNERPREKLLSLGAQALSDAELLAIFLRTGVQGKSAIELARVLLHRYGTLRQLLKKPLRELATVPGIGEVKYTQLQACLELGRRYITEQLEEQNILNNPAECTAYVSDRLRDREQEVFACLFLTSQNELIAYEELFFGSLTYTTIHPREVLKRALAHNAASVILCHNHPSGQVKPSQSDIDLTSTLKKALALIEISVLDHLIVGKNRVFSMANEGYFKKIKHLA